MKNKCFGFVVCFVLNEKLWTDFKLGSRNQNWEENQQTDSKICMKRQKSRIANSKKKRANLEATVMSIVVLVKA